MKELITFAISIMLIVVCAEESQAQLIRKFGQYIGSQFMRESTEEALEQGVKQGVRSAAKEATEAGTKAGIRNASGRGLTTSGTAQGSRIAARYGDEAIEAFAKVTPQNARRLQMISEELVSTGKADDVWAMIAKGGRGDQVVDFLWRNKGTLAGSAVLTSFIANPEGFLDGTSKAVGNVTESVGTTMVEPLVRETGRTAINWLGATILLSSVSLIVCWGYYCWNRRLGEPK